MNRRSETFPGFTQKIGACVTPAGVGYCVWAPDQLGLFVTVERGSETRRLPLTPEAHGYWAAFDSNGRAGDLYGFVLADGRQLPDIASRFQPQGVHGPSECIDSHAYHWQCADWKRPGWTGQSIYEIHVGTFTEAGTYRSAIAKLDQVRDLGVEAIELMPLADFGGNRNWGYDGVALYAPARCYGRPDDLRALVDAAHARGLAVILDVVYNHLGPAGNYLAEYSAAYFRSDQTTPWGRTFDVDGADSHAVRNFLVGNAAYWLDDFRFDGLRLDATHAISDRSSRHLLEEMAAAVHARGGFLIAEDERNDAKLVAAPNGEDAGFDALWADDFHHEVRVALTSTREAYYSAYRGTTDELASTLTHGWTYRGQPFGPWNDRSRGTACDHLPARAFVVCIENHDQVGNRANGERLEHLVSPRQFRAASLLLCLGPYVPLIFMGQEWAASTPFLFFTDHGGELGAQISAGRQREFEQHGAHWRAGEFPNPEATETFLNSKLRWTERSDGIHAASLALYRECLQQRRVWLRESALHRDRWQVRTHGDFIAIRYRVSDGERLLLLTLGEEKFPAGPLPVFLSPPAGQEWRVVLHSEEQRFGGDESGQLSEVWTLNGPIAVWFNAVEKGAQHATD